MPSPDALRTFASAAHKGPTPESSGDFTSLAMNRDTWPPTPIQTARIPLFHAAQVEVIHKVSH